MDSPFEYKISNIGVVYEDEWLLVVDKPAGLLTIPAPKKELRTLSGILNEDAKKKGFEHPIVMRIPPSVVPYIGTPFSVE